MKVYDLMISRSIPAPPDEVFAVWLDPNTPGGPWFGANRVILNAAVDGLFYQAVLQEGKTWAHYGRFTEIDPPRRVAYTWVSEATQGLESIVEVTFEPSDGKTVVTLRHSGLPDDEQGRQHQDGWDWMLSSLVDRFGGAPA
jgi:uncharacterized protein YndB with AHSA1/START domain